jgi:hypothetical protein
LIIALPPRATRLDRRRRAGTIALMRPTVRRLALITAFVAHAAAAAPGASPVPALRAELEAAMTAHDFPKAIVLAEQLPAAQRTDYERFSLYQASCRIHDTARARAYYAALPSPRRDRVAHMCTDQGIDPRPDRRSMIDAATSSLDLLRDDVRQRMVRQEYAEGLAIAELIPAARRTRADLRVHYLLACRTNDQGVATTLLAELPARDRRDLAKACAVAAGPPSAVAPPPTSDALRRRAAQYLKDDRPGPALALSELVLADGGRYDDLVAAYGAACAAHAGALAQAYFRRLSPADQRQLAARCTAEDIDPTGVVTIDRAACQRADAIAPADHRPVCPH